MAIPVKIVKAAIKKMDKQIAQKKNYKEKVTTPRKKVVKAAKQEAKANARGLKAANKPVSKNNEFQWGHIGSLSRNRIKNMEPARPNRIRGGSMKSKLNWPKDMK